MSHVQPGINDIATINPRIVSEWDYEKNGGLTPNNVSAKSNKKYWWKCALGHSWDSTPDHRSRGQGCLYCSRKRILTGYNDLKTQNAALASEWNYTSNNGILPDTISPHSNKKFWWVCSVCGNEWAATPNDRMNNRGCPECSKHTRTSFPEQATYYYLKKAYADAENNYSESRNNSLMELDIYIPSLKVGIEYDGVAWHANKASFERDQRKYEICKKSGIKLVRISEFTREDEILCDHIIYRFDLSDSGLEKAIIQLIILLGISDYL